MRISIILNQRPSFAAASSWPICAPGNRAESRGVKEWLVMAQCLDIVNPDSTPLVSQYVANPCVLAQRVDDEMVLIHLETDQIYQLNRTATLLWEFIAAGNTSWDVICDSFIQRFQVDAEQLASEVDTILRFLDERQLVVKNGPG